MTRINTNVSSLTAQKSLARSNVAMQQAMVRLSTGLRINSGKDDPAGLIASEVLRSDIVSAEKAISNSQRANQMIATADSALGQASSLLNDIRGLVTEAANEGAMGAEQIAANQLQVDSALEALNRIAQTTTFQGRKLLDGSLDFILSDTDANFNTLTGVEVQQASFAAGETMAVTGTITAVATKAEVTGDIGSAAVASEATWNWGGNWTVAAPTSLGSDVNGVEIYIYGSAAVTAGQVLTDYNSVDQRLNVYIAATGDTDYADVGTAIETAVEGEFGGDWTITPAAGTVTDPGAGQLATGTMAGGSFGGTDGELVLQLSGKTGSQVFSFDAGTEGGDVANAINLVTDATGVAASYAGGTLTLTSSHYGSNAFVDVDVITDDGTFRDSLQAGGAAGNRDTGTDIGVNLNGIQATADGNFFSINTAILSMSATADGTLIVDDTFTFTISGGGALFQIGPDVVTNQQARIGIGSVNSGSLGGASGRLYQIGSGKDYDLETDPGTAALIVDQVIEKVTSLRGRLGAFQRNTLEANIASLNDTVENLVAAESAIRDADFAAETAALTRAQILTQAGTSVLAIANSNPQNVLALLQ